MGAGSPRTNRPKVRRSKVEEDVNRVLATTRPVARAHGHSMARKGRNLDPSMIVGLVKALAPVAKGALSAIPRRRRRKSAKKRNRSQLRNADSSIPAAVTRSSRSFVRSWTEGSDMHVAGCDLVRKIPQSVVNSNGID